MSPLNNIFVRLESNQFNPLSYIDNYFKEKNEFLLLFKDSKIAFCCGAIERLLDFKSNDLIEKSFANFLTPQDNLNLIQLIRQANTQEICLSNSFFSVITKNSGVKKFKASGLLNNFNLEEDQFDGYLAFSSADLLYNFNMTRSFYETIVDNSPNAIAINSLNGNFIYVNNEFVKMTGYSKEEIIGQKPNILKSDYHDNKYYSEMWNTLLSGKIWRGEFYNKRKDGSLYWEYQSIAPILDDKNDIIFFISIKQDITEKKENEIKLKEYEAKLKKIISEKDKLIAILSHDLRNPIAGAMSLSEILEKDIDNLTIEEIAAAAREINKSLKNIFDLLKTLLDWAYAQLENPEDTAIYFNVREQVISALQLISIALKNKKMTCEVNIDKKAELCFNLNSFKIILNNLLSNAYKFSYENSVVIINFWTDENFSYLSVENLGAEFPAEKISQIYQEGKTYSSLGSNKEEGKGLGLMLVKQLVEKNNASLSIESFNANGNLFKTIVKISFPLKTENFY